MHFHGFKKKIIDIAENANSSSVIVKNHSTILVVKNMSNNQHKSDFISQNIHSIPESMISEFVNVCSKNYPKETFEFLIGYKDDSDIIPTEMVFSRRLKTFEDTSTKLDDVGKFI